MRLFTGPVVVHIKPGSLKCYDTSLFDHRQATPFIPLPPSGVLHSVAPLSKAAMGDGATITPPPPNKHPPHTHTFITKSAGLTHPQAPAAAFLTVLYPSKIRLWFLKVTLLE
jgi:hypothetical protein